MAEIVLKGGGLSYRNTLLTNFSVSNVLPLFNAQHPEKMVAIELKVHAPDGIHQVTADISRSITRQILDEVPCCRLIYGGAARSIDAYLIEQAANTGGERILCRDFGLQRLYNGQWIFVAGDEILGDCGAADIVIHPTVAKVHLAWNRGCDERTSVVHILRAIENNPTTILPTIMHTKLSSLRSQVSRLGITTFPTLYLVGQQNSGKSWLVEHYSLLYDDETAGTMYGNLDASSTDVGVIRTVSGYKDTVVAVDDLLKSSSSTVRKRRPEEMEKLIHLIANGSTRVTASANAAEASLRCQTGVVCTAEISLIPASIITRLLEVSFTGHKKTGCGSDRADAATTFRRWMLWLLPRLDAELEVLKKLLAESRGEMDVRLESTKILFLWTTELFYRFAWEEDFIEEIYYREALDRAKKIFGGLLAAQAAKVARIQDKPPRGNLSYYILKGYHEGRFHVVSDRKKMKSNSDCLVENDTLCIRTKTLLNYLRSQANFQGLTEKSMSKRLREEGVLPDTKEKRAATKKINGQRYLELSFSALNKAAQKY